MNFKTFFLRFALLSYCSYIFFSLGCKIANGQNLNYQFPEKTRGAQRNEIAQIAGTATIPQNRTVFANASGYLTSDANFWQWDGTHAKLYQGITNGSGWLQIGNPSNTSDAIELGIQSSVSTGGGIAFSEGSNKAFIRKMGSGSGANLINPALNIPENSYLRIENPNGGIFLKGPNVILGTGGATTDVAVRLTTAGMLIGNNTNMINGPNAKLEVNGNVRAALNLPVGLNTQVLISTTGTNELFRATSTLELKDNITDVVFNRDTFLMLKPRDFVWKPALGGSPSSGFVAEEVADIMPQLAVYGQKEYYDSNGYPVLDSLGNPVQDTSQMVPVYVDYNKITTYMMAMLKDYMDSLTSLRNDFQTRMDSIAGVVNTCCSYDTMPSARMANQSGSNKNGKEKYFENLNNPDYTSATSITLEHTYPPGTSVGSGVFTLYLLKLGFSGEKYAALHADSNKLRLFNLDYSLFKEIDLPFNYMTTTAALVFISENLFDTDSAVEYLVQFGGAYPSVKVYNEDGSILWEETDCTPGCEITWVSTSGDPDKTKSAPIMNTEMGTKMVIHCNVPQQNPYYGGGSVKVYGLPGSLIGSGLELYNGEIPSQFKIYPNPSGNSATIEYALPQGESNGEIEITNLMGSVVKKVAVVNGHGKLEMDNTQLPAGTYFYQLQTSKGVVGTKKMIILR